MLSLCLQKQESASSRDRSLTKGISRYSLLYIVRGALVSRGHNSAAPVSRAHAHHGLRCYVAACLRALTQKPSVLSHAAFYAHTRDMMRDRSREEEEDHARNPVRRSSIGWARSAWSLAKLLMVYAHNRCAYLTSPQPAPKAPLSLTQRNTTK